MFQKRAETQARLEGGVCRRSSAFQVLHCQEISIACGGHSVKVAPTSARTVPYRNSSPDDSDGSM